MMALSSSNATGEWDDDPPPPSCASCGVPLSSRKYSALPGSGDGVFYSCQLFPKQILTACTALHESKACDPKIDHAPIFQHQGLLTAPTFRDFWLKHSPNVSAKVGTSTTTVSQRLDKDNKMANACYRPTNQPLVTDSERAT